MSPHRAPHDRSVCRRRQARIGLTLQRAHLLLQRAQLTLKLRLLRLQRRRFVAYVLLVIGDRGLLLVRDRQVGLQATCAVLRGLNLRSVCAFCASSFAARNSLTASRAA
jgi:hypothetical protein